MSLVLVTASTPAITLAEAKAQCRIDGDDEDALLTALIRAAAAHAERWTGTVFEPATWDRIIDRFPSDEVMIPLRPVVSVTSVSYVGADGISLPFEDFTADLSSPDAWLLPVASWPSTMDAINAVRVRFIAGRGTPDDARAAMLLMIGHWYANREASSETKLEEIPLGAYALLNLHRQMFV